MIKHVIYEAHSHFLSITFANQNHGAVAEQFIICKLVKLYIGEQVAFLFFDTIIGS